MSKPSPHRLTEPDGSVQRVDHVRIAAAVREILLAVGEDPDREGLRDTPDRVARMYEEMFAGLHKDPATLLKKTFVEKYDEMVLVKDITFDSMCEHHLLPFFGRAHIAYIPNGRIVGLSKLPRVVEMVARRPQVQERMTEEIADLVMDQLDAQGAGVVVEASHTCMAIRGVRKPGSICTTSAMRGIFRANLTTRSEFLSLIRPGSEMAATFCLRLAAGLLVVLPILPVAVVPPRFYRVQFLVALGLLAVAAVFLRDTAGLPFWLAWGAATACCFAGSIVWHLDRAPGGGLLIWLAPPALLACLVCGGLAAHAADEPAWRIADDLASTAVLGSATTAMLMGHSYLIAPAMSMAPLLRLLIALGVSLALRIALACVALWLWSAQSGAPQGELLVWLPARWALGLLGPLALAWMAWETARIRSTQSATGILYVVVIVCYLGELTSQLLLEKTGLLL